MSGLNNSNVSISSTKLSGASTLKDLPSYVIVNFIFFVKTQIIIINFINIWRKTFIFINHFYLTKTD